MKLYSLSQDVQFRKNVRDESWLICRVYGFQGIDADFTSEKHRAAAGNP